MQQSDTSICPTCKSLIPTDAPGGLCPACAFKGASTVADPLKRGRRTPPPSIEAIAPHFPELELVELLGVGGMGAVYKARQPQLDRFVAIKVLSDSLAQDPAFVERFNREAKVLARLNHPNIVSVFDFGTAGPYCFLLMEYIDGVNVRQAMHTGGFQPAEALAIVGDMCAALQSAHDEGILHRDIKPENVLIDSKGRVKIADFGIAKLIGPRTPQDVTLTVQGEALGTPQYMAPEQIEARSDVDQRADIYSLGVVLYEMLTGELPIGRFALPSEKAEMDARIDQIVLRTLEKEREARYQSAAEVGTQVQALGQSSEAGRSKRDQARTRKTLNPRQRQARSARIAATVAATGLALVLAAVALEGSVELSVDTKKWILRALLATGTLLGVIGTVTGLRTIGLIRQSSEQKSGMGAALFAAAASPLLLTGILVASLFSKPTGFSAGDGNTKPVEWKKGTPELVVPVTVAPHVRARFRLFYFDGRREELADIGELIPAGRQGIPALRTASTVGALHGLLAFGMSDTNSVEGVPDGGHAITGLIETTGQSGSLKGLFHADDYVDPEAEFPLSEGLRNTLERPYRVTDFLWNYPPVGTLHVRQAGVTEHQLGIARDEMGALKLIIVAEER